MREAAIRQVPLTVITVSEAIRGYYTDMTVFPDDAARTEEVRQLAQAETDKVLAGLDEPRPASVTLKHPYDYRQVLVTAHLASGEKIDVTRMAPIAGPANVRVSPNGLVRPTADGQGELSADLLSWNRIL